MSPQTLTTGLTRSEREAFEAARKKSYLVDRSRRRVYLANAWWPYCERADRPYVEVRHRKGRTSIVVDLRPCGAVFPEASVQKIFRMWKARCVPGSVFFFGRRRVTLCRIPDERIEELAGELYRIAVSEARIVERKEWDGG